MNVLHVSGNTALRARNILNKADQHTCSPRIRSARHCSVAPQAISSTRAQDGAFAATVSPDVADESSSSSEAYEQGNSKATTQQSSGASHIKPCYPEKTINCSDGKAVSTAASVQHFSVTAYQLTCPVQTAEEWKARIDLAAIYRVCHNLGLNEGINNHLTAMVPGMPGHFLVFPFGLLWSEVTASNLLLMDNQVCCLLLMHVPVYIKLFA